MTPSMVPVRAAPLGVPLAVPPVVLRGVLSAALRTVFAALVALAVGAGTAAAQPRVDYRLTISEGGLIKVPRSARTVLLADPSIADVQLPNATNMFIFGKKAGRTTLFVLDEHGNTVLNYRLTVGYSDEELRRLIRADVGDYPITMTYTPSGAVLSGTVPTPQIAEKVRAAAARFLGEGQALVDNLLVTGHVQVEVRVRVAEVSRTVTKQLGVNWSALGRFGNTSIGLVTGRTLASAGASALQAPGGVGSIFGSFSDGRSNVTSVIDALATEGLVKVLAEPNLVATSGETATFVSGGQFPVPIAQGLDRISVEYRNFGIGLTFQPTVLSENLISMHVIPEVSELSTDGAVTENNFNVPALRLRKADTTIELGSGQSFAIAGLIQDNFNTTVRRYPGLGDIPILGALFRSSTFQRNESELVIIVTPYIVRPAGRGTALGAPSDLLTAPSDLEEVVFGRLTGSQGSASRRPPGARLRGDYGFLVE